MPDDLTAEWLQNTRIHQESAAHALEVKDVGSWCLAAVVNVDSPRLVAAIEAVLKETDRLDSGRGDYGHLVNRHEVAAAFRSAITRELAKGNGGHV